MIESRNATRAIWASAAVAGVLLVGGLAIVVNRIGGDETLQLSADLQSSAEPGVSQPASELSGEGSSQLVPDDATEVEQSADPSTDPASPTAPSPEDPEVVEGTPGVVVGNTENPTAPSGPASPPSIGIEDVDFVPVPKSPTPTPPAPEPIDILQVGSGGPNAPGGEGGESGGLAPNVSGCALACVTKAVLTPNLTTPNLELDVETTVPARIDITLTNTDSGEQSLFTSSGFKTQWSTTLSPLAPGTDYDLVFEAFDQDGQRQVHTTTLTTRTPVDGPGGLQTNQPGCAGQCIVQATVTPTGWQAEVRFDVVTDTPASVKIWVSTSAPTWNDGIPSLPPETIVEPTLGFKQEFSVEKSLTEGARDHHVVVRAEDEHGVDYQVGTFVSAPLPASQYDVRINVELIFVQWDGDPSPGDRGELSFAFGYETGDLVPDSIHRTEEKLDGGTTVPLGDSTVHWATIGHGEVLPSLGVTAMERDAGAILFTEVPRLVEEPTERDRHFSNPAWGPTLSIQSIQNQQTCGDMGVDSAEPDAYCVSFQTVDQANRQFPNIQTVVSYELHER